MSRRPGRTGDHLIQPDEKPVATDDADCDDRPYTEGQHQKTGQLRAATGSFRSYSGFGGLSI